MSLLVSPRRLGRTVYNGHDRGSYNGVRAALGDGLPPGAIMLIRDGIDSIGLSTILYQSGDASTWQTTAVWGFEYTAAMADIDTALGGGVLFIGETPKHMTWAQWMIIAEINVDYLFIGLRGIAGYSTDQTTNATRIRNYLNSVDEELLISDIFNGLDTNGFTFANPPVVPDQDGALRISAADILAVEGGLFVEASSTWIEKTPAPAKKTLRTLTGNKTVYTDTDPIVWKRTCVNPTRTNKCTCRKINPTDTTNITKSGDAAVLSVVDDSAALIAAGLDKICTSGKVYELDNSAGTSYAEMVVNGGPGNLNRHSLSFYSRVSSGVGTATISYSYSGAEEFGTKVLTSAYTKFKGENKLPPFDDYGFMVKIPAGCCFLLILPQLEEGAFCTDPIITAADPLASITRTGTSITKPTAGLFPMVSATKAQNFGIYARFNPKAAGQVAKLWASYTDANNCTCLDITATTVVFNKRLVGTDIPVNRSLTHAANVPVDVLAIQTDMGMSIKVRTYSGGVWSAWSAWTDDATANGKLAAVLSATLELGASNSTGHFYGNIPFESILDLGAETTLAAYKAVAETEVAKINA